MTSQLHQTSTAVLPSSGGSDMGDAIDNSCIFNDGDSPELSLTYTLNAPWTFSAWIKRGELTSVNDLLGSAGAEIHFNADDTITAEGLTTTALFRDTTSFYHIHVSNNGLFVNGVSHGAVTTTNLTNAKLFDDFDGYATDVHLQSGTSAVTNFGRFSTSHPNTWVHINGTAGEHHLTFSNSAALGENSGSGSDWTATNLTSTDQSTNTPTNVRCVMNSIDSQFVTLSEGALQLAGTSGSFNSGTRGTFWMNVTDVDGFYWEITANAISSGTPIIGISEGRGPYTTGNTNSLGRSGTLGDGIGYQPHNGVVREDDVTLATLNTFSATDVIGVLVKNSKLYYRKNGTWENSGDPDAETGFVKSGLTGTYAPASSVFGVGGGSHTYNFGDSAFADTAPTGSKTLKHSDLSTSTDAGGVLNPEESFVTTLDTETNIVASMDSAQPASMTSFFRQLKNRTNIESRLYRFSHDASNEYIITGTYPSFVATRQAVSSLSGSDNWFGHDAAISANYLTAGGSQAHTNGVATTITHNLGTARVIVFLFERGTGKDIYHYHPDFSSGDLLILQKDVAPAASTQITNVLTNSIDIGSGAATATYDYFIAADGGSFSMGTYSGNGVVDGPYLDMGGTPAWFARKQDSIQSHWDNMLASGGNENDRYTRFNAPQAEGASSLKVDFLSAGIKIRDAYLDQNGSGLTHYWFAAMHTRIFSDAPFPNAR